MAYQIDFTAANYASRSRRKWFLRLLFLVAIGGIAWGVHDVYVTYNQPTLNMKLADYEAVARPIEEINFAWDKVAKEYGAMVRYYRLIWAANPTNFLEAVVSQGTSRLGRDFQPQSWSLKTGGECRLDYRYVFHPGDKAAQAKGLQSNIVNAVSSIVQIESNTTVVVEGVKTNNLLTVDELNLAVKFFLPKEKEFPRKNEKLVNYVNEIGVLRKKVHDMKIVLKKSGSDEVSSVKALMMDYSKSVAGVDKGELPPVTNINIAGFFESVDKLVKKLEQESKREMPGRRERLDLKMAWNVKGEARWPWTRERTLDNDELVADTKILKTVSDGVKRFKGFLDLRLAGCKKKLEPLIESYDHDQVFNEPLIEADLKDRFAKAAGILHTSVTFEDEPGVEPAVLVTTDKKFTFTWVRWTLKLGREQRGKGNIEGERQKVKGEEGNGEGERRTVKGEEDNGETGGRTSSSAENQELPLTLERLADCARRVLKQPGPGYVLDTVKVNFDESGNVVDAVLEGLLPVKKEESLQAGK